MSTPDACTHRLERGEIFVAPCPDGLLPESEDLSFLMQQRLNSTIHKNISYNPQTDIVSGFVQHSPDQAKRLQDLLRHFSSELVPGSPNGCPITPEHGNPTVPACAPRKKRRG